MHTVRVAKSLTMDGQVGEPLKELGTVSEAERCLIILDVVRGQKFVDFFELIVCL